MGAERITVAELENLAKAGDPQAPAILLDGTREVAPVVLHAANGTATARH